MSESYRDQMNQIAETLSPANHQYFDDLNVYITAKRFFGNEEAIDKELLSMVQDLKEAEADGASAKALFGDDPKKMGDELLRQLPPMPLKKRLGLVSDVVWMSWLLLLMLSDVTASGGILLNLAELVVMPVAMIIIIAVVLKWAASSTFKQTHTSRYAVMAVVLGLVALGLISGLHRWQPAGLMVRVVFPWSFWLVLAALLFALIYMWWPERRWSLVSWALLFGVGLTLTEQLDNAYKVTYFGEAWMVLAVVIAGGYGLYRLRKQRS